MPALRTDAKPARSSRQRPAREPAVLSATSSAASPAHSSPAFSLDPGPFPAHSSAGHEAPPASPPAATGHKKGLVFQLALEPGLDDLAKIALHKRDYPDAMRQNHFMEGPGDGAADQLLHLQSAEPGDPVAGVGPRQGFFFSRDDFSALDLQDQKLPGNIEHRRNAPVPYGNRGPHAPSSPFPATCIRAYPSPRWPRSCS